VRGAARVWALPRGAGPHCVPAVAPFWFVLAATAVATGRHHTVEESHTARALNGVQGEKTRRGDWHGAAARPVCAHESSTRQTFSIPIAHQPVRDG